KLLRQHSTRSGKLPSGGKHARFEQKPAASRFRFVHGQGLDQQETSLAERKRACCAFWPRRAARQPFGILAETKGGPDCINDLLSGINRKKSRRKYPVADAFLSHTQA